MWDVAPCAHVEGRGVSGRGQWGAWGSLCPEEAAVLSSHISDAGQAPRRVGVWVSCGHTAAQRRVLRPCWRRGSTWRPCSLRGPASSPRQRLWLLSLPVSSRGPPCVTNPSCLRPEDAGCALRADQLIQDNLLVQGLYVGHIC